MKSPVSKPQFTTRFPGIPSQVPGAEGVDKTLTLSANDGTARKTANPATQTETNRNRVSLFIQGCLIDSRLEFPTAFNRRQSTFGLKTVID